MKIKFIILGIAVSLLSSGAVYAENNLQEVLDEAIAEEMADVVEEKKATNKFCPISGEEIGTMGEGIEVEHDGEKIKLCCAGCALKFNKDPEMYLEKAKSEVNEKE